MFIDKHEIKKCNICGTPLDNYYSDFGTDYIFCEKHYYEYLNYKRMTKEPKIAFHMLQTIFKHKKIDSNENKSKENQVTNDKKTCIVCGHFSDEYNFCKTCYQKYKNKSIVLRINNCETTEILNAEYENPYTCEDGHPVKSQQEALIDNYLFYHNIRHIYEKPFPIDGIKTHDLHPDFYLPDLDLYIEHWGMKNNKKYEETKEYKIPFYEKAGITLICTDSDDISNISANLERKLKYYEKGKINWFD